MLDDVSLCARLRGDVDELERALCQSRGEIGRWGLRVGHCAAAAASFSG